MREIKFRVWNWKKISSWDIIKRLKTVLLSKILEGKHLEHIPMQYTWLKDRNWKEIYEGDILQYKENRNYWKVEFIEWCFKILRNFSDPHKETFIVWWYHEVIWNIYEDKHLLTN